MIESIREYFNQVVADIYSEMKPDGSIDSAENVSSNNSERFYKLTFGSLSSRRINTNIESDIPVTLTIYAILNINDLENEHDCAYNKAIGIQALAMEQSRVLQNEAIKSVASTGIEKALTGNDDNSLSFTINFTVKVSYSYKEG